MLLLEKSKYRHCCSVLTVASVHSGDLNTIFPQGAKMALGMLN